MRVSNGIVQPPRQVLARCLRIWALLQSGPLHVVALSQRFSVSARTIERDMRELYAAGAAHIEMSGRGWYQLNGAGR